MKINEAIFSADGTFIRLEMGKEKFYISKGKFYDCCPINCFAKVVSSAISKQIQAAVDAGGYNAVKEVKQYIKDSTK